MGDAGFEPQKSGATNEPPHLQNYIVHLGFGVSKILLKLF